ncbi:MAG: hypothetical protein WA908_10710 [Pontixanthobacter sp.]
MSANPYSSYSGTPGGPAHNAFAIIASATDLPFVTSAIYVGSGGDVAVVPLHSDTAVTYRNVPSGAYLTIRAKRVLSAGTTASDLIGEV